LKYVKILFTNNDLINSILNEKVIKSNPTKLNLFYKKILKPNENELNKLSYNESLKLGKKNCLQYYYSLIVAKHPLFFTFFQIL